MSWRRAAYLALLQLKKPRLSGLSGQGLASEREQALLRILNRHRCVGGCYRLFTAGQGVARYHFGLAGPGRPCTEDTSYRIASLSKMLTALCCMKLVEEGRLQLDEDVNRLLPFRLRHSQAEARPITLRMLLQHSSGIRDGRAYEQALLSGASAETVLQGDSFDQQLPGEGWYYSNFAFGLVGSLLEAASGLSFEQVMQQELFQPLGVRGSFYPQRVTGELADAVRLLPREHVAFDARERRERPLPEDADLPMPDRHYNLAQGNCCVDGEGMERLAQALLKPGYLSAGSLRLMMGDVIPFGARSAKLSQGLGLFEIRDDRLYSGPVYGHQGKAYGAVHGAYVAPESVRGFLFLTSGASEAYREFLTDLTEDLIRFSFTDES